MLRYKDVDYSDFRDFAGKQVAMNGALVLSGSTVEAFVIHKIETIPTPPDPTFILAGAFTRPYHDPVMMTPVGVLKSEDPSFSDYGRAHRINGTVVLMVGIDDSGKPREAQITHSLEKSMDAQAVAAASKYVFSPAAQEGVAVPYIITMDITFEIH
jgi:TonB family protein